MRRDVQAFPKPSRLVDEAYLAWIRTAPCLICSAASQAHHTRHVAVGGSDYRALPLCFRHHEEYHRIGRDRFEQRYRLDIVEEIIRKLETYLSAMRRGEL